MEDYALIARQEKQIEALKTENDYLKKVKTPTQIENATLQERNDALELENNSLKSEIQTMTVIQGLHETQGELDAEYALAAASEKQIEALKTENDYLKKVKTPTQIENATLQERTDALELENNSLKSEVEVINEKYETVKRSTESAKLRELGLTKHYKREKRGAILGVICICIVVVLFTSGTIYHFGHRNGSRKGVRKGVSDARSRPQFLVGQVMYYLVMSHKSGETIFTGTVSENTGVHYDDVLSILLTLEKRGILTKSHHSPPTFYLKE